VRRQITLEINERAMTISVEPRKTLADALRDDCGLTGTHLGCEHGVCGACTVLLDDQPVRSCLMFAIQCEGRSIRTVEGLGTEDELHPLQAAFSERHGLQCGFCTPGFLMLATWIVEQGEDLRDDELRERLSSNLCRCTGYQSILAAVKDVAEATQRGSKK
jgi:aerobic carbon-monoxide dehydrogenase small subunit